MGQDVKLHDVSLAIHPGMIQWVGEEIVAMEPLSSTPVDVANVTRMLLATHSGTHVDAPRHFVHGGTTIDDIPLERWVGPCWVADVTRAAPEIESTDLERAGIPVDIERLILKTTNSLLWRSHPTTFVDTFVGLSLGGAKWVVERDIRLVGIDYLSIAPFHTTIIETHQELLGNGVVVVEGLDLHDIEPGRYELLCFPLKIRDGDGAPARVALRGPLSG